LPLSRYSDEKVAVSEITLNGHQSQTSKTWWWQQLRKSL